MNNGSSPLRIGIIGCGAITQLYYVPAIQALAGPENLRVSAVCDPNRNNGVVVASAFDQARYLDDFEAFLREGIDLAIVASPPIPHASQSMALAAKGVNVLCEKPMASSLAEAEAMAAAAESAGTHLSIGLYRRFFPAILEIKEMIASGMLGSVTSFQFFEGGRFDWNSTSAALFTKGGSGGGVLLELGVHMLDLIGYWFGEPKDVSFVDDAMGGIEANCWVDLAFPSGTTGTARLSRDWSRPNRYFFNCERGWIDWSVFDAQSIQWGLSSSPYGHESMLHEQLRKDGTWSLGAAGPTYQQCFVSQLRNCLAAVRGQEKLLVPASEALPSMRLIDRCYRVRQLVSMPWLGKDEAERAQALASGGRERAE